MPLMAALSYNPSFLCSVLPSNSTIMMSDSLEKVDFNTSISSLFLFSSPSGHFQDIPVPDFQDIPVQAVDAEGITDQTTKIMTPTKKKRKCKDRSRLRLAISKDSNSNSGKGKKQRNCNSYNFDEAENRKSDDSEKNRKKGIEVAQNGTVYVRARRGEASDRHSLAERVRRERIREKLNLLQSLVPGCDKMCSKAQMLDEIISYVQSLQHHVEFLSMKLAHTNLMINDSGRDISSMANPETTSVSNFQDNCDLLWGC